MTDPGGAGQSRAGPRGIGALGAALLLALGNACGGAPLSPPAEDDSASIQTTGREAEIEVRVMKGPIQPVERPGERNVAPVPGAVVLVVPLAEPGTPTRLSTDTAGTARLGVEPGTYRVSVETCPGAMSLPKVVKSVSIGAGKSASTEFVCDTGIR